jgi:CO/xanthine dehydrogenase FAD-binding subunit
MKRFRQFVVAGSPEEAVHLRKALGAKALFVAGGTGVVPFAGKSVEVLIDITRLGLEGIRTNGGSVEIGATTKMSELLSPEIRKVLPMFYEATRSCATPIIRNMATIGGSLATAFLPSDLAVALLAYDASLTISGEPQEFVRLRELLARGWLKGHDLIHKIRVTPGPRTVGASFQKFGRGDIDIALANVASVIEFTEDGVIADLCICVGQTSSMPVVLSKVLEQVQGQRLSRQLVEGVASAAAESLKVKSDFRASTEYRKHVIKVLIARSLVQASREAGFSIEN